jgi:hypothetical protein
MDQSKLAGDRHEVVRSNVAAKGLAVKLRLADGKTPVQGSGITKS